MGIFKDLLLGAGKKDDRAERTERIDVRGSDERREIYDSSGHWKEEHRWNPRTDRWDKLDMHGNVMEMTAASGSVASDADGHEIFGASPDVANATTLVERMKLGETRVWWIGEVR